MLEFVLCVIDAGILLVNAQKTNRDTVGAAAVVQASAQISAIRDKLPWSWRTVIGRAEVWSAVRPGVWATSRSAERSTNPLSTMWR